MFKRDQIKPVELKVRDLRSIKRIEYMRDGSEHRIDVSAIASGDPLVQDLANAGWLLEKRGDRIYLVR